MKLKKGLFDKLRKEQDSAPWSVVFNALAFLQPGDKVPIPGTRFEYEQLRESLKDNTDPQSKDQLEFVEFVLKHADRGNFEFKLEA